MQPSMMLGPVVKGPGVLVSALCWLHSFGVRADEAGGLRAETFIKATASNLAVDIPAGGFRSRFGRYQSAVRTMTKGIPIFTMLVLCAWSRADADCIGSDTTDCPPIQPLVTFDAVAITAGPYGEMWKLSYGGAGKLELRIDYILMPMGDVSGNFLVSSDTLTALRKTIREQRFYELPKNIAPEAAPFHAPDLRLEISVGGQTRQVQLYDPDSMQSSSEARRFLKIWEAVFSLVPLQPSWKERPGAARPEQ